MDAAQWTPLFYAVLLLITAIGLLILEFFIVSFGLLSVAALTSGVTAIYFAFQQGTAFGYGFIIAGALLSWVSIRWGLRRIRTSSIVPKSEITGDAGYHHVAERLGIKPGSTGVMVTPARPSGRARFAGGECDVQGRNEVLTQGCKIKVERIEGPIIFVTKAE